jgi:hypothetical protein
MLAMLAHVCSGYQHRSLKQLAELAGPSHCKAALQSRVECSQSSSWHGIADLKVSNRYEDYGMPGRVSLSMSAQVCGRNQAPRP